MTNQPIEPGTPDEHKALDQAVREVNYAKNMYVLSPEKEQSLLNALYEVHVYRLSGKTAEIDRLSKIAFGILQTCPPKQNRG